MRYTKTIISILFLLIYFQSCSTANETDKKEDGSGSTPSKTTFIEITGNTISSHQKTRVIDVAKSIPKITIDGYESEKTYTLELTGEFLGETYTLNFLSTVIHDTIHTDTIHTTLDLDTNNIDLKSDYYTAKLKAGSELLDLDLIYPYDREKPVRIADTQGSDFYVTIQFETNSWVPKDTLTADDFRMRPTPSLANTEGKLYIYDTNKNPVDSIQSNGASGSNRNGVTYWYSLKFRTTGLTISNGQYLARFERRSENIVSPFRKITLLK